MFHRRTVNVRNVPQSGTRTLGTFDCSTWDGGGEVIFKKRLASKWGVTFLPGTGPACLLTGYDYGPDRIISHGLLSRCLMSRVR